MTERHSIPTLQDLEVKLSGAGQGTFSGYAATFGPPADAVGDIIAVGAFTESLKARTPVMLWSHISAEPIGKWLRVEEDAKGLFVEGALSLKVQRASDAYALLLDGVGALSIGYKVRPGGQSFNGDTRTLTALDLYEISLVSVPANSRAQITSVKDSRYDLRSPRGLERALRDLGLSQKESKRLMSEGFRGLLRTDEEADLEAIGAKFLQLTQLLRS